MRPLTTLLFCTLFVTCGCNLPDKPAPAKKHIVKDLVQRELTEDEIIQQAVKDSLCKKLTPKLFKAVTKVESSNRNNVAAFESHYMKVKSATWDRLLYEFEDSTSHCEAQIMGREARKYGVEPKELRKDKETCYRLAALMLGKDICDREKGDIRLGIVSYNAGPMWRTKSPQVRAQAFAHAEKVLRRVNG